MKAKIEQFKEQLFNFDHKHSLLGKIKNILFAWSINIFYILIAFSFLTWMFDVDSVTSWIQSTCFTSSYSLDTISLLYGNFAAFFMACIFAPIWEEAAFRFFPIQLAKSSKDKAKILLPIVIISSIVFGICHGSIINIMIQGAGGFILAWVALKNNDFWSSVIAHAIWNWMIMFGLPFLVR